MGSGEQESYKWRVEFVGRQSYPNGMVVNIRRKQTHKARENVRAKLTSLKRHRFVHQFNVTAKTNFNSHLFVLSIHNVYLFILLSMNEHSDIQKRDVATTRFERTSQKCRRDKHRTESTRLYVRESVICALANLHSNINS